MMKLRLLKVVTYFPVIWTVLELIMPRFVPKGYGDAYAKAMIVVGILVIAMCALAIAYSKQLISDKFKRMLFNAFNAMIGFVHLCALVFYLMYKMQY
jgi:hypothetical protein